MTWSAERFGRALGKAVKGAATVMNEDKPKPVLYRVNMRDVPPATGLTRADGWVDAQVQVLVDKASADAGHSIGRTVLKPGARHDNHRHRHCDSFLIVLEGQGRLLTEKGDTPSVEGDVVFAPRGCWQGFNNTSNGDVVLLWGIMGAGSMEASGYEAKAGT